MALAPGTRLGAYEILSLIGAGGMGEVYRARDARLGRDVAVKVLPASFSADTERLQRFEQEARAAAALNHPNIVAVFDVGTQAGVPYVVSELLEGETLRERLTAGPLPTRKTIEYGIQLAHGLSAAHEKGIVHRDLKPENIFVMADGRVKILDFGLAKLTQPDAASLGATNVPTTPPNTQAGMVLGTMGYMSPEQVRGLPVDQRSDIFALGAVLYEMLTGRRAFQRDTDFDTMTAIVKEEVPDLQSGDRHIPPALERIIHRCLEKSAASRFQAASDLAFALDGVSTQSEGLRAAGERTPRKAGRLLPWLAAGVLGFVAVASLPIVIGHLRESAPPIDVIRFSVSPPPDTQFEPGFVAPFPSVSPDGRRLALIASRANRPSLWVRSLDAFDATMIPGTEGAAFPFWSADGRSVAFFADGKLKKVDVAGGTPQTLCDAPFGEGGSWNAEGTIVFGSTRGPLQRVPSAGGRPTTVTKLDPSQNEWSHGWPSFLSDGQRFLYSARPGNRVFIGSIDGRPSTHLLDAESKAVAVDPGYVLFVRTGTLFQQAFDASALSLVGDPTPLAENVRTNLDNGRSAFSASHRALVYRAGQASDSELVWFDRKGARLTRVGEPGSYDEVELSPDGTRAATLVESTSAVMSSRALWIFDVTRGIRNRLTFGPADDFGPRWTPKGDELFFSRRAPKPALYSKTSDGSGDERQRLEAPTLPYPDDVSPDGQSLLYEVQTSETDWDIWMLPLAGDAKARPVIQGPFRQEFARFSPDGRWIAYRSNESGRFDVYVTAFPGPGGKRQVSTSGGGFPRWSRDGREIFFVVDDNTRIVSAEIRQQGASIEIGTVTPLFEIRPRRRASIAYDVSPDGRRFLVNTLVDQSSSDPLSVVINWQTAR